MADISKITLPSGNTYNLKDAEARNDIEEIRTAISGGVTFMGVTTTALTDGATTTTIVIGGQSVTAAKGYLVAYGNKEFIFDGSKWLEVGDLSAFKALAYKDSASGSFTPAGSVSQPTFTGSASAVTITATDNTDGNFQPSGTVSQPTFTGNRLTLSGTFTPSGSISISSSWSGLFSPKHQVGARTTALSQSDPSYTPSGTVSTPTISRSTAGSTTTVNSITNVGTLPSFTATVADENLTLAFSAGTLPTKGADTTVKTGDASYTSSRPVFTGDTRYFYAQQLLGTFEGTAGAVSVTGTPSGTVSQPTFTGTKTQLSGTTTPSGTVSKPTFTGTEGTVTVS